MCKREIIFTAFPEINYKLATTHILRVVLQQANVTITAFSKRKFALNCIFAAFCMVTRVLCYNTKTLLHCRRLFDQRREKHYPLKAMQ